MDFGQCIEAMRSSLGNMFEDPRLASEHRGRKQEVEAGFVTMCSFAATLSSIQLVDYDLKKFDFSLPESDDSKVLISNVYTNNIVKY